MGRAALHMEAAVRGGAGSNLMKTAPVPWKHENMLPAFSKEDVPIQAFITGPSQRCSKVGIRSGLEALGVVWRPCDPSSPRRQRLHQQRLSGRQGWAVPERTDWSRFDTAPTLQRLKGTD